MALQLASLAIAASANMLVNAAPVPEAVAGTDNYQPWSYGGYGQRYEDSDDEDKYGRDYNDEDEYGNDDDDDEDYNSYGRWYRQYTNGYRTSRGYNNGYRNLFSNWYGRQNRYSAPRTTISYSKRSVDAAEEPALQKRHIAQQISQQTYVTYDPRTGLYNVISQPYGGVVGNLYSGSQPQYVYLPQGYQGYSGGYYPAAYPQGYTPNYYSNGGISQPLYAGNGAGSGNFRPNGWPPVVGGPSSIPFITNTLPGGVGNVGFGVGSSDFSVDSGYPSGAPVRPNPTPVGPPAAGITATLAGGVGNVGLGIGSAGFTVDGGVVTPATTPVAYPVDGGIVTPVPAPPTPVSPPASGITATLAGGVGNVGLNIGSADFSVDGTVGGAASSMVRPSSSTTLAPVRPSTTVRPSPVGDITATLAGGVGNVGLGIGSAGFSVDGVVGAATSTARPAAPVVATPVQPRPAPEITATLSPGGVAKLGIQSGTFSVGN